MTTEPRARGGSRRVAWLVGVAAVVALTGGLRAQSATRSADPEHDPRTIAVLPFTNISGMPKDDWLSSAIAETVTADLARLPALSVIAHDRLRHQPSREHALQLGASWLVTGGFQRVGNRVRITARLTDVVTGAARDTMTVDGTADEVFALQDQVVTGLSAGLAAIAAEDSPGAASPTLPPARPASPTSQEPAGEGQVAEAARRGPFTAGRPGPAATAPADPESSTVTDDPADTVTGGLVVAPREEASQAQFGVAAEAGALTGRQTVRPTLLEVPPVVDGRLDDLIWTDAVRIDEFVQSHPNEGEPATEYSEVWVAYDDTHLYLAFYAHYSDPGILRANRSDRDQADRDDHFSVYFDTFLDQQRAYVFSVNGYGVQGDSLVSSRGGGGFGGGRGGGGGGFGGAPRGDSSWDALFESAGQLVEDGFTAEMAIPFKSLRYPRRGATLSHRWGFQIVRTIRDKDETDVWSPTSRSVAGFLPQMGVLDGMVGLSTSRNIELQPTFTAVRFGSLDTETGGFRDADPEPEGGLNFKYGVTSNLTADLTFNPDFSQVESDRPQIEANQRFALFFPELRPFFLEGAEIFSIGPAPITAVHTRTIVDPRYGAKLTGKVGNTTVGVMYANDEAPGNLDDLADPAFGQSAQTFVGRVRYDLYSESHVGAIVTNREFMGSHSRLAGVDSNFRLGDTHSVGVKALGTQHRDLDGLDTSGYLVDVQFRKNGRNLDYMLASYALSPDFATDVGFVRRTDQRRLFSNVSYRWWPQSWLINWGPRAMYARSYNFDGVLEDENASTGINFNFSNNIGVNANINRDMERFGGVNFFKTSYGFFGNMSASRQFSFGAGYNRGDQIFFDNENPFLGFETGFRTFITLRPISRLQSQININTNRFTDPRNGGELVFDVKIFRALTTYQFTDRLLFRNISEYNTLDKTLGLNFLFTYRVNSGTAFFIGYDDRYRQSDRINNELFFSTDLRRTNRAIFTKFQYLFRL